MRATHLAPIDAKLAVGILGDKGDALAEIKARVLCAVNALDFNQRNVGILRPKRALVAENGAVHMQTRRTSGYHGDADNERS